MTKYESLVIKLLAGASRMVTPDMRSIIASLPESGRRVELLKRFDQLDYAVERMFDYDHEGGETK